MTELTPETLSALFYELVEHGYVTDGSSQDTIDAWKLRAFAHIGAWEFDELQLAGAKDEIVWLTAKVEALERGGQRLLDLHDFCPTCNQETAGQYGHKHGCADWCLFYPAALQEAKETP